MNEGMKSGNWMADQDNASAYLQKLARRNARVYEANPKAKAILLMGSAAEGQSDFYSDLDMAVYYEELPYQAGSVPGTPNARSLSPSTRTASNCQLVPGPTLR